MSLRYLLVVHSIAIVLPLFTSSACTQTSHLETISYGGSGPPTLVLLHGYGSSAERWVPFTQTIQLPRNGRFVFPQGHEVTVPPDGPADGRAWWRLDLRAQIPPGGSAPDLSATRPPGLAVAAALVEDVIETIERTRSGPILLGGFSQGAMVAGEVAFRSDTRIAALVLLSGTPVDEASWERGFARRVGMPVFLAHGRSDPVLPFSAVDRFREKMEAAGLNVTWVPFDGAHEMPAFVVTALNRFIASFPDSIASSGTRPRATP